MPLTKELTIDRSKPVLVTGATGYIAGVLCRTLLEQGLTVHATVRDLSQTARLEPLQRIAKSTAGTIRFFQADLLQPGSFAAAMHGCAILFHTASPFLMDHHVTDADTDLIQPAVRGTQNVLTQACQTPTLRRVVLTSSVGALLTDAADSNDGVVQEECWNRTATRQHMPYCLSKTLAEQAAWVIAGSQTQWQLLVLNPSLVLGPGLQYSATSESYQLVQKLGSGDWETWLGTPDLACAAVHMEDVAEAHLAAAFVHDDDDNNNNDIGGRYVIHGHSTHLPALARMLGKVFGAAHPIATRVAPFPKWLLCWVVPWFPHIGLDRTFLQRNMHCRHQLDASKSQRVLGLRYRSLETAVQGMYQQLIDAGRVPLQKRWYHALMQE